MKNKETENRPLMPILRAMKVGDVEKYPRNQYRSIASSADNLAIETGMRFSRRTKGDIIEVTRIA